MNTDVLFESAETGFKAFHLFEERGLLRSIRFFISPERPYGLSKEKHVLLLPYVLRSNGVMRIRELIDREDPVNIMVRNLEELGFLRSENYRGRILADSCLYSFNRESRSVLRGLGISEDTVPLELTFREMKDRGCRGSVVIIYGRAPLMVSAQCAFRTVSGGCRKDKKGFYSRIKDRKNVDFPYRAECNYCYNVIYNSVPTALFKDAEGLKDLEPSAFRMDFTTEKAEQAADITDAYLSGKIVSCMDKLLPEFTRGHFKKGV